MNAYLSNRCHWKSGMSTCNTRGAADSVRTCPCTLGAPLIPSAHAHAHTQPAPDSLGWCCLSRPTWRFCCATLAFFSAFAAWAAATCCRSCVAMAATAGLTPGAADGSLVPVCCCCCCDMSCCIAMSCCCSCCCIAMSCCCCCIIICCCWLFPSWGAGRPAVVMPGVTAASDRAPGVMPSAPACAAACSGNGVASGARRSCKDCKGS